MDVQTFADKAPPGPNGPTTACAQRTRRTHRQAPIDRRANLILLLLAGTTILLQFVVLPCLLTRYGAVALWLALPLILIAPTHWGLIHEAIHGQLFAERRINEWAGRSLAIAFWLPFEAVRFGHLMHHRFTREPYDQPDVHESTTHRVAARITYYLRLLGGLYVAELAIPLLAFAPLGLTSTLVARAIDNEGPSGADVQRLFVGFATNMDRRRRIRRDWLLSLVVHAIAFYFYGTWWPALVATMYLRGVWLSLADNLPHYDVSLDEPQRARNFRVPAIWRPILMNHQLHQLHHRHPTLPWTALPALARESGLPSADDASYFNAAIRQFSRFGRVGERWAGSDR